MKAIGYDDARGDQVEVANIPFKSEPPQAVSASPLAMLPPHVDSWLTVAAIAGAALLVTLFLLRALFRKRPRRAVVAAAQTHQVHEIGAMSEKIIVAPDPRREQLVQIARDYHDATVRIIRMWLQEENGQKPFPPAPNGKHAELN
jgi:flagellar biosynthesis/type III secretory pathway M-ring protein FliF/YscJ